MVLTENDEAKIRCRRCHLTLNESDLKGGCCPECMAERGERNYDFEAILTNPSAKIRYRCEQCGILIENRKSKI